MSYRRQGGQTYVTEGSDRRKRNGCDNEGTSSEPARGSPERFGERSCTARPESGARAAQSASYRTDAGLLFSRTEMKALLPQGSRASRRPCARQKTDLRSETLSTKKPLRHRRVLWERRASAAVRRHALCGFTGVSVAKLIEVNQTAELGAPAL